MRNKLLTVSLVACALTACADNHEPRFQSDDKPISSGAFAGYACSNKTNSDILLNARHSVGFTAKAKRNTSQTTPDFKMPGGLIKGYALYQVDIYYHTFEPDPNNPGSLIKQNIFDYKNIDFEYDNKDLIFKIPQDEALPACQIRFKNDGKIGEHQCEFKKSDVGYRAATFNISCSREGKIGTFREP